MTPVRDLLRKVRAIYERIQPYATDPMLNFDERDLLNLADEAGFEEIYLNYEAEIVSGKPFWGIREWEALLKSSGNPKIPTLGEAMTEALTPEETERFTEHLRPLVENARRKGRSAVVYLQAIKDRES